ncbi:hypothetical protein B0H13DRAFT_2451126 [Mycena leptocephala]|nr:hypothetical protein B0H13DRAFT_2451126 [Mycena leptocephala]
MEHQTTKLGKKFTAANAIPNSWVEMLCRDEEEKVFGIVHVLEQNSGCTRRVKKAEERSCDQGKETVGAEKIGASPSRFCDKRSRIFWPASSDNSIAVRGKIGEKTTSRRTGAESNATELSGQCQPQYPVSGGVASTSRRQGRRCRVSRRRNVPLGISNSDRRVGGRECKVEMPHTVRIRKHDSHEARKQIRSFMEGGREWTCALGCDVQGVVPAGTRKPSVHHFRDPLNVESLCVKDNRNVCPQLRQLQCQFAPSTGDMRIGSVKRHGFKTTELNFGVEELDPCESSGCEIDFLALRGVRAKLVTSLLRLNSCNFVSLMAFNECSVDATAAVNQRRCRGESIRGVEDGSPTRAVAKPLRRDGVSGRNAVRCDAQKLLYQARLRRARCPRIQFQPSAPRAAFSRAVHYASHGIP